MSSWRYYNHAMIPTTSPHENVDISCIDDGSIWKENKNAICARWTSDFDCGYDTGWYYIIREAPYDFELLSKSSRKNIRHALKKCYVRKIKVADYAEELYVCYEDAHKKYINADNKVDKQSFIKSCFENEEKGIDFWAGFEMESQRLIGYITVVAHDIYAEIQTAKFSPQYFKCQVSDALYHMVLEYYLNTAAKKYISSGSKNINHITNTQEYKEQRFQYRKAYCKLHLEYNPRFRNLIKIMYFFKGVFKAFDRIKIFHQINGLLLMEEIHRKQDEDERISFNNNAII